MNAQHGSSARGSATIGSQISVSTFSAEAENSFSSTAARSLEAPYWGSQGSTRRFKCLSSLGLHGAWGVTEPPDVIQPGRTDTSGVFGRAYGGDQTSRRRCDKSRSRADGAVQRRPASLAGGVAGSVRID